MFMGYSGHPVTGHHKCTEESCLAQTPFRTYVHYVFPRWFVMKSLTITLLSIFRAELGLSLTVNGVAIPGGDVIRAIQADDVNHLKQLFRKGLALPNDRMLLGPSLLYVSYKCLCPLKDYGLMLCRLSLHAEARC